MTPEEQRAYDLGAEHARNAASWLETGNADHDRHVLAMFEDGDPAVDEYLPRCPNLSGEYADDLTPALLLEDLGLGEDDAARDALVDALCDAYEAGVCDAFLPECERILRAALAVD